MMKTAEKLDELLFQWQEAQASGKPITVEELCREDTTLAKALHQRIQLLQSMQWMDGLPNTSKESGVRTTRSGFPKIWQTGQEPVPGYRLIEPLGRGGFSEVWEAAGPKGIKVALKLVFADRAFPEEQSLELLKQVRHPRIVSVFGAWSVERGFVIAMEQADESVHDRWSRIQNDSVQTKDLSEAALLAGAEALDVLNQQHRIQHRDVKPQNLLMFGDYIKLADFGIAKVVENHSTGHTGYFTVAYAAPEFFRGRSSEQSDQYSLAVTYTLLRCGKLPFIGNSAEITYGHLHRSPDLSSLPPEERSAVARALAKEPRDRWASCREFANAVISKKKVLLQPRTRRQAVAGVVAVAIGATAFFAWKRSRPRSLELVRKFDVPAGNPEGLYLRQVVGSNQAIRLAGERDRWDYYVVGNGMAGAYVWDGKTGRLLRTLSKKPGVGVAIPNNEKPWCMTGHNDGTLFAWNMDTGTQRHQFAGHQTGQHVTSIDISSDTYRSVTSSTDQTIKVWEHSSPAAPTRNFTGKLLAQFNSSAYVMAVKFLPNGRTIASVGHDGLLQLWDSRSSKSQPVKVIEASNAELWSLDISLDGNNALTGGADNVVRLWDLNTGTLIRDFVGHEAKVEAVAFTSTAGLVMSGSSDNTLRIWNRSDGTEEYRVKHDSEVQGICAASVRTNGAYHLTATRETVYAWKPPT